MKEQFANYQIGVEINRSLPQGCCEVTVKLDNELSRIQGWKKRTFICSGKEIVNGKVLKPIHQTEVDVAIYEWDHPEKKNVEIKLNSLQIKLFKV